MAVASGQQKARERRLARAGWRSFGEYLFLEDSRYASQVKNVRRDEIVRLAPVTPDFERRSIQPARFFGQHDRDAGADRIGELGGARDQLLLLRVVFERALGQRADQNFQELRIDAAGGALGRGGHDALQTAGGLRRRRASVQGESRLTRGERVVSYSTAPRSLPPEIGTACRRGARVFVLVAKIDAAAGEIVGRDLHHHAVADAGADAELAHFARHVRENLVVVVEGDGGIGVGPAVL